MKYKNKITIGFLLLTFALTSFSCGQKKGTEVVNTQPAATATPAANAQTPTDAFKMLYAAVKAQDTDAIKQLMSKSTHAFAAGYAQQSKQTIAEVFKNGMTATTLADTLPEIRDERIKDNFGAVEVFNSKDNRWEDLPFVLENGGWRLAVGDIFQDTYKSPGKSVGQMETEKANPVDKFPTKVDTNAAVKTPPVSNANSSTPIPVEEKPKQ